MKLYIDTKPTLEWVEYGQHHYADIYEIERLSIDRWSIIDRETCFIIIAGVVDTPPYYDTVAEAKAAAQADYDRRTAERFVKVEMLPKDVTISDIKQIRNYFGEHDKTLFEHRAYALLDSLIKHIDKAREATQ